MNRKSSRTTAVGSMRSVMLGACLAMLGTLPLVAQDAGSGQAAPQQNGTGQAGGQPTTDQRLNQQLTRLTKVLSLTQDQVTQIKPILQNQMTQMTALRQDTDTSQMDKRQQMMQIRSGAQTQIRALLTSDQQPKYDALLAQEQQHMGRRRGGMSGGQDDQTPPQD
jgi:periplasmic protein CpxP/Spy